MSTSTKWLDQVESVHQLLEDFQDYLADDEEALEDRSLTDKFVQILHDACEIVRDAEQNDASDLKAIVEKVFLFLNEATLYAYGDGDLFEFMPSYAHSDACPLIEDSMKMLGQGIVDSFFIFFKDFIRRTANGSMPRKPGPGRWTKHLQPHPNSTRLSRFREGIAVSVTAETPLAQIIHQARCEITDRSIYSPMKMVLASDGSCLAIAACGGWKNRDPVVQFYVPGGDGTGDLLTKSSVIKPGLSDVAMELALDETRQLIFVADDCRIKSYLWADEPDLTSDADAGRSEPPTAKRKKGQAVHTLRCDEYRGPIALFGNSRIARAGKGAVAFWNIDALETHGSPGQGLIGFGKFNKEDTWRDTMAPIELSTGSDIHMEVALADSTLTPAVWHMHGGCGQMLCSENGKRSHRYGCVGVDLEHGGQIVTRYLGHGGDVENFSTSDGDKNVFLTAGSDGFARLFDVRHPLPVITLNSGSTMEYCPDAILVHPDGIPTVFTAGQSTQQIKVWDVRARGVVYELATGNNAVLGMAWDSRRWSLYAATECEEHEYRRAIVPKWARVSYATDEDRWLEQKDRAEVVEEVQVEDIDKNSGDGEKEDEDQDMISEYGSDDEDAYDDDGFDDEDEADDEAVGKVSDEQEEINGDEYDNDWRMKWPKKAFHAENYFGYALNAGGRQLYRYAFKADADQRQAP